MLNKKLMIPLILSFLLLIPSAYSLGLSYSQKDVTAPKGTNITYPVWISNSKDTSITANYLYRFQGYTKEEQYTVEPNSNRKIEQTIQTPDEIGDFHPYFEVSVSGGEGGTSSISTKVTHTVNLHTTEETTTTTTTTTTSTTTTTQPTTTTTTTVPETSTTTTTTSSGSGSDGGETTSTSTTTSTTIVVKNATERNVTENQTNQTINQTANETKGGAEKEKGGIPLWVWATIGGVCAVFIVVFVIYWKNRTVKL